MVQAGSSAAGVWAAGLVGDTHARRRRLTRAVGATRRRRAHTGRSALLIEDRGEDDMHSSDRDAPARAYRRSPDLPPMDGGMRSPLWRQPWTHRQPLVLPGGCHRREADRRRVLHPVTEALADLR